MSQSPVQYNQSRYDDPLSGYQNLTDVISDIAADLDRPDSPKYSVVWKTANYDHGSDYRVVDTKPLALEETLIIEGQSRGGRYQVVPRGSGPAVIRHLPKDGSKGWEAPAEELVIMYGRFEWNPEKDGKLRDWLKRLGR